MSSLASRTSLGDEYSGIQIGPVERWHRCLLPSLVVSSFVKFPCNGWTIGNSQAPSKVMSNSTHTAHDVLAGNAFNTSMKSPANFLSKPAKLLERG